MSRKEEKRKPGENLLNKRERILKAAVKLISERGFYNTTTDTIAKEAGVASGTIYNYFSTKEEILGAIFEEVYEEKRAYLNVLGSNKMPFSEKLKTFLARHFQDVRNDRCLAGLLVKEYHLGKERALNPIRRFLFGIAEEFGRIYENAKKKEDMFDLDKEIVSTAIFGAIQAITMKAVYLESNRSKAIEEGKKFEENESMKESEIIDNIVKLFCYGVYKK